MSSPKTPPAYTPVATFQPTPPETVEEEIPEIVVTAKRIPWYAWVAVGAVGFLIVDGLARR